MDGLGLFAAAFALGLAFNAAPGAVFAETVRQGVSGGFRPALAVQAGSLAGDASWAVIGLAGAAFLAQLETLRWPLGLASAGYLLWLSWDSWRAARLSATIDLQEDPGSRRAFRAGVLLSLTNPQNIAYWAALGSAMAGLGLASPQPADYLTFFAGFMVSSVLWCFICAGLVSRLQRLPAAWARLTYRVCAALLLALALSTLRELVDRRAPASPAPLPAATARP